MAEVIPSRFFFLRGGLYRLCISQLNVQLKGSMLQTRPTQPAKTKLDSLQSHQHNRSSILLLKQQKERFLSLTAAAAASTIFFFTPGNQTSHCRYFHNSSSCPAAWHVNTRLKIAHALHLPFSLGDSNPLSAHFNLFPP